MAVENQISVIGNLADDPELRFTPNGTAVANIRVAVNRRKRDPQSGEWDDQLDGFFTVNVWREMAENVADTLSKGARVVVIGRLRTRSYEDREGQTRWVTEIEADEVCPSLRFARAEVTKTRSGGGSREPRAPHPADDPGAAGNGSANGDGGAAQPAGAGDSGGDAVPF